MNNASNTLLVSLGTSWAIVPEAFLLPGVAFRMVSVLTTASDSITPGLQRIADWFAQNAPEVNLSICRVDGFTDLGSESDHFAFEEVLYRWMLPFTSGPQLPYVCLSGGFKTMSAAVQKAATLLGAAEVFHVLCASNPATPEAIAAAHAAGALHFIRLGAEPGWPQFRGIDPAQYPLVSTAEADVVSRVFAPDDRFRQRVGEIVERSHRIASTWETLADLPFQTLATWSRSDLDWLGQPLDPAADREWVEALPKLELHCHLGGFASHGSLLAEVRAAAQDPARLPQNPAPARPEGWPRPKETVSLKDYMTLGDATGSKLLRDPGCLQRHIELLYRHLQEQRVIYAEIRCSPANYATPGRSPWTVLEEIRSHFQRLMEEAKAKAPAHDCHVNLVIIATRRDSGNFRADIARHLALAVSAAEHWKDSSECHVAGVDLAGFEDRETRAHYFREEFIAVHRCGLALTIHAGENDDAEGIWSAVFDLNARRLGHALELIKSPELMQSVAARGIAVEMCPYANYQIKGFAPMPSQPEYPLLRYLRDGILVTVNTDNIGISDASLSENLLFTAQLCPGIRRIDLLQLQANALEAAFLAPTQRAWLRRRMETGVPLPRVAAPRA